MIKRLQSEMPVIESTPIIQGKKCKAILYALYLSLLLAPILVTLWIWLEYGLMFAVGGALLLYLLLAIILSKLRLLSIPRDQLERNFSTLEIAKWYTAKRLCIGV